MHGAMETGDLAQASRSIIAACEQRIRTLAARIEELRREGDARVETKQVLVSHAGGGRCMVRASPPSFGANG